MNSKNRMLRMAVDFMMILLLPVLMAYSLVGETLHEVAGTVMLVLFIAHHILNFGSIKVIFRGKYTVTRALNTLMNITLLAVMILLPASGIAMSKHIYTFLSTDGLASAARKVHMLTAYWGFVLMSLHLGMHVDAMIGAWSKHKKRLNALAVIVAVIAAYGVYAIRARQLAEYLFLRTPFVFFDFNEPRIFFFLDYLAMMILFAWIGFVAKKLLYELGGNKNGK